MSPDGAYTSAIANKSTRFGVMIGGLVVGRLLIAQGAVDASKVALTIAIRYSISRPQFGDRIVMDYVTHQRRLLIPLSTIYALSFALLSVKMMHARNDPKDARVVHENSCGLKAMATWTRVEAMQYCRECCGGQGYLTANQICTLKTDMDVDVTFEGDNTVLMQQTARPIIAAAGKRSKSTMLNFPQRQSCPIRNAEALMEYRAEALARQAYSEIAQAGGDEEASNRNLDLVVEVAWAAMELYCLRSFSRAVMSSNDKKSAAASNALWPLLQLFALSRLEKSSKFYLEYGAMQASEVIELRKSVNSVCQALNAQSSAKIIQLIDGFGLPECTVHAPIARDWRTLGRH